MSYREQRDYENLQRAYFQGEGEYDIPILGRTADTSCENWIGWNFAKGCEEPEEHGIHFFVDDYQFLRLWRQPDLYLDMLSRFQAVCTPDFSLYVDFPKAIQVYNHYRKYWLGAYWQMHGITVIPTISWSDPDSLSWCFDGAPKNGVIAFSTIGVLRDPTLKEWTLTGYEEMIKRLNPTKIIWKGKIPEELEGDRDRIFQIPSFTDKWHESEVQ